MFAFAGVVILAVVGKNLVYDIRHHFVATDNDIMVAEKPIVA